MDATSLDSVADRLARRAEAFECFQVQRRELSVSFEAGRLKSAQTNHRSGLGLRVVAGGRVAVGGTPDPTAVERTIDSTLEAAAFGDPWPFAFAPPAPASSNDVYDPAVARMQVADLVATGRQIVARLGDLGPGATISVSVEAGEDRQAFVNSAGQRFDYQITHYGVSANVEFFGADDIFGIGEYQDSCRGRADLDWLVATIRRKFEQARRIAPAGAAEQSILFSPGGLHGLLVPLMAGLNGQSVADGVSPLADKRGGERILDPKFTLVDDATLAGRSGSQPFDDEGTPGERTVLIGGGRVENFLLDLRTAAKLNLKSTGNASRGLTSPPTPAASNLIVQPGDVPLDRMIAAVGDGLLVEYLLGVGQGNVTAGDYANPIGLAYKIRGGEIVGRAKNCSIAGNVYNDLANIAAIEDRGQWYGSTCLPHVRLDGLALAVTE